MASASTSSSDGDVTDTPNQFDVFKATIRGKFNRLHLKLTEKEQKLLDDMSRLQQEYEDKRLEINNAIQQIENLKLQTHNLLKSNLIEKDRNEQLMTLDERIKQLNLKKNNINLAIFDLELIGSIEDLEELINGIHVNANICDPVIDSNLLQGNEAQEQGLSPDMDRRQLVSQPPLGFEGRQQGPPPDMDRRQLGGPPPPGFEGRQQGPPPDMDRRHLVGQPPPGFEGRQQGPPPNMDRRHLVGQPPPGFEGRQKGPPPDMDRRQFGGPSPPGIEGRQQGLPPDMERRHLDRDQEFPGRQGHMGDMHYIMNPNNRHIDPMQNEMNARDQRMMASTERAGMRNMHPTMQGRQDDQMIGLRPDDPRYAGSQRNQNIGFQDHRIMRQFMDPQMKMRGRMLPDAEIYQMRMIEQQMAMMRMRDPNLRMQMFGPRNMPPQGMNPELINRMEHNINPETDNISQSEDLNILIREYKALNKSQEPIVPNQSYEFPQKILEAAKSCVYKKDDIPYKYEILPNIYDIILTCLQKHKSVTQVKESFKAMSIYPLCLYLDPRRPEFHTLRRYTGYFTYKISEIVDMSHVDYIFSKMGYSYDKQNEVYQFNPPQNQQVYSEHICRVGCELLIAIEELSQFEDTAPPGIDPIRHFVIKSQSMKNDHYQVIQNELNTENMGHTGKFSTLNQP